METQLTEIREQKKTWNKFSPGWKKWDGFTMKFLQPMGDAIIAELNIKVDCEEPGDISIKTNLAATKQSPGDPKFVQSTQPLEFIVLEKSL